MQLCGRPKTTGAMSTSEPHGRSFEMDICIVGRDIYARRFYQDVEDNSVSGLAKIMQARAHSAKRYSRMVPAFPPIKRAPLCGLTDIPSTGKRSPKLKRMLVHVFPPSVERKMPFD